MVWSGVNSWDKVPTIWGKTEDTKTDTDLGIIMQTEWVKARGNDLHCQLYNFEWNDNLPKLIQT